MGCSRRVCSSRYVAAPHRNTAATRSPTPAGDACAFSVYIYAEDHSTGDGTGKACERENPLRRLYHETQLYAVLRSGAVFF